MSFPIVVVIVIVLAIIVRAMGIGGGRYDALVQRGVAARGILLQVASTGSRVGLPPRAVHARQVTVDVEIPGREPYVVQTRALIPMNLVRDVLPGATLELRVDPRSSRTIAIVGPGAAFSPMALLTGPGAP